MDETNHRTRWQNAFVYALVTTVMVLSVATVISEVFGASQRALANRVDQNSAAIVCILRLGVDPQAPERSTEHVNLCLADPSWLDGPSNAVKP